MQLPYPGHWRTTYPRYIPEGIDCVGIGVRVPGAEWLSSHLVGKRHGSSCSLPHPREPPSRYVLVKPYTLSILSCTLNHPVQWLDEETWVEVDSQTATSQSTIISGDEARTGCTRCPYKWTSDGHLLKLTSTSWWALHIEKKGKQLNVDTNVKMQSDCLWRPVHDS